MISTGRAGRAVAVVSGGSHDGTIIRLADQDDKEAEAPRRELHEVLDEGDYYVDPKKYKLLPLADRMAIAEALAAGEYDDDDEEEEPPVRRRIASTYKSRS